MSYDLDTEDGNWIAWYNGGQSRLPSEKYEDMLYRLEIACAHAMEKLFQTDAALAAERGALISFAERTQMIASTSALTREAAMEALGPTNARQPVYEAVYQYWVDKRARRNRPLMRVFQMPPPGTDTNPYNVFRPREKITRPQTRRRRENDSTAFQKMQEIRRNLDQGLRILEMAAKRERRKRDIVSVELELQMVQMRLKHEPRSATEGLDAEGRQAKQRAATTTHSSQVLGLNTIAGIRKHDKKSKKNRNRHHAVNHKIPAPPPPAMPEMLFALDVDMDQLAGEMGLPPEFNPTRGNARFGRGGRIVFDRCNPLAAVNRDGQDAWVQ